MVVALQNRNGPVSSWELMQIAAIQQAISAFEDVIADLDAEAGNGIRSRLTPPVHLVAARGVNQLSR